MSDTEARLGGRLPLLDRTDWSPAQKTLGDKIGATMGRPAAEVGYESRTSAGSLIGPFNPMLRSPDVAQALLQLQAGEAMHTSLSERTREVVILSVGSVWKAPYELYSHSVDAVKAGFSRDCVAALAAGLPHPELKPWEEIARRLALALTVERAVDDGLYADALRELGEKELVDLSVLVGCYQLICGMLNLFAVPAP